ncbi:PLP-dependent aminotransferase family protein [Micromonospora polyrhachis]|uniref:GntR family transcriptional regulator/MocR family aminotransferase n=1 Tax=Micromonospora polyrhachis TaxID=1282883 RepID=A0A7W7SNM6_9ACTN|nr:PLP-dependent aminotransferase family protein [Micromonospora polyrhachis]MBB4958078.1 GntR family transcriptional regulator/MocR family aminotransferase [Micromonospora polyrhachis]
MSTLETLIELDRSRPGLTDQLTEALREAIVWGRLAPGTRLPASRGLAADLRLSRGVVVEAYEQLVAEGRLVARRGSGTVVAAPSAGPVPAGGRRRRRAARLDVLRPVEDRPDGLPDYRDQGVVPLRPGVPDTALFPRVPWRRAYERALRELPDAVLDYGDPAGAARLRVELAGYLGRVRSARVEAANLLVTTGAAQAFHVVAAVLRSRGETRVGFEDPGSLGLRNQLLDLGLRPVPVPVDADGLDVAALDRTGVRAVVVTPAHQFPTGVVLAPARRAALLAWARRVDGLIVEDDYDAEFRYDRDPVGCLQGLAPELVAHISSVSKSLAPAMRLGWLAVPPPVRAVAGTAKFTADLGGPVLEQMAFAEFLASGGYDRHLRRARRVYRQRRDALVEAVRQHLPEARISGVAAGLHLVVELPDGIDDVAWGRAARAAGLGPLALSRLRMPISAADHGTPPRPEPPGLVLGYAAHSPAELVRAVRTLAALIH